MLETRSLAMRRPPALNLLLLWAVTFTEIASGLLLTKEIGFLDFFFESLTLISCSECSLVRRSVMHG